MLHQTPHASVYTHDYSNTIVSFIGFNPCANNNGGCTHLCLLSSTHPNGYTCACHNGTMLQSNRRDCIPGKMLWLKIINLKLYLCYIGNPRTQMLEDIQGIELIMLAVTLHWKQLCYLPKVKLDKYAETAISVSYTHLTLPTIYSV